MPGNFEPGNSASKYTTYDSGFDSHPAVEVAWLVSGNEGYQKKLGIFSSSGPFGNSLSDFLDVPDGILADDKASSLWIGNERLVGFRESGQDRQVFRANQTIDGRSYHHPLIDLPDPNFT